VFPAYEDYGFIRRVLLSPDSIGISDVLADISSKVCQGSGFP
jgi:hypothetical protein